MSWREQIFGPVRRKALKRWLRESRRTRLGRTDDDFSRGLECQWQARCKSGHVALFCGIGEWASHMTDILMDGAQDNLRFDREPAQRRLARHYARLMFVVAELLNDFEDSLSKAGLKGNIRSKLGGSRVGDFHAFVNQVIKHKAKALHHHDHHLPLTFTDGRGTTCARIVQLGTCDFRGQSEFDCILMPSLDEVLDVALTAYQKFNDLLMKDDGALFQAICKPYEHSDEMTGAE